MLERLEGLIDHFVRAPDVDFDELGRAAEKLANLCKTSFELSAVSELEHRDLQSFLDAVSTKVDPYGFSHKKRATPNDGFSCTSELKGDIGSTVGNEPRLPETLPSRVPLATTVTKEVLAERIKWKLGPSFDPLPFLSDPVVHSAFLRPDVLRIPEHDWPRMTRAQVHCKRSELLQLAQKWDELGACRLVTCDSIRRDEAVGMFAVSKDQQFDRLIVNPTVINSRQFSYTNFTKTLAPGALICLLRLEAHENLVISSDDLCEFYYTFKVSEDRAARNAIGMVFDSSEVCHLRCFDPKLFGQKLYICLGTLAMGDGLAVEIAQQSHFNLLRQLAGCLLEHEIIAYRQPIPRGPFYELLTIDDHIGLQKVSNLIPLSDQQTRDKEVFANSDMAYQQVGLTSHPGKRQRQVSSATVLGAEVDGVLGRVSAPRSRVAMLMFVTAVVVQKQRTTRRILQSIIGTWVHVLLFRRVGFSVLESVFHEGVDKHMDEPFTLSRQSINELINLMILGPLFQTDLRTNVCPEVFMMDASPSGGAICRHFLGHVAVEEIWRHTEQRGYYTQLQSGANLVLHELGLDHTEMFGHADPDLSDFGSTAVLNVSAAGEDVELAAYDCIELFAGQANWSRSHAKAGLRVHPGVERNAKGVRFGDLSDKQTFLELAHLAAEGKVKEWHAAPPCWSFGTLRRPRLRSKTQPAGFDMLDELTWEQTRLAIRTAFILMLALSSGCFISVEQPGSSVMFELHIFRVLLALGCVVTKFPFCSFGSGFMKPSKWLHNKPWLLSLESRCTCAFKNQHFVIEGSFTRAGISEFDRRCKPSCQAVYGKEPRVGEALSSFSAAYPIPLCEKMARGSVAAHHRFAADETLRHRKVRLLQRPNLVTKASDRSVLRAWFEDPDWVADLCETVQYKELFRYRFKKGGHINVLECRVYKSWLKHSAKRWGRHRLLGLLDSRVTMGAAAKGRSSSKALSRVLRSSLGCVLGGGLYPGCLHVRSAWNRADGPSRGRDIEPPSAKTAGWIQALQSGDVRPFELMLETSKWTRPIGRWVRLLLLIAGDVERNPGPVAGTYQPRGELDLFGGLSRATTQRMQSCLCQFSEWLQQELGMSLDHALESPEMCNLSLRAYGRMLYAAGRPRYQLVYTITAVQRLRPEFRSLLGGAWHVDRVWQLEQPGQCRAVLSAPIVRALICLGLLWGWRQFVGVISIGFAGMLHPNEFIQLVRQDVVLPEDALLREQVMYIHIRNPKTARFARRQHAKIDDPTVILLVRCIFGSLPLQTKLFDASMAAFRRQWNFLMDFMHIPRRQTSRGATPGVLRGSGATQQYIDTEDIPKIAWRGRWARTKTLEFYVQEVAAQLFLHQLSPHARSLVSFLEQHCMTVLLSLYPEKIPAGVT